MTKERLISRIRWVTASLVAANLLLVLAVVRCQQPGKNTGGTEIETNQWIELPSQR